MRSILKSQHWLTLLVIPATDVEAQVNPVYQEIQKNGKAIRKGRRQIKPNLTIIEPFVDLGYNDSTLARLRISRR